MKKPQIIAAAAVVLMGLALVLGIVINQRSERAVQSGGEKPVLVTAAAPEGPAPVVQPEPEPEPKIVLRYRAVPRPSAPAPDFDATQRHVLPKSLQRYRFRAGILVDLNSRRILWESHAAEPVPIASVTKLLTLYTAFEEIEDHPEISLDTLVTATTECSQAAPVRIHLKPGNKYRLHELFVFAMLKSANDAAHLIAEYFGYGRSEKFIEKMNRKAREIGMMQSTFVNANGLPIYGRDGSDAKMNLATMRDMAKLMERLFDYPMILRYTACKKVSTSLGEVQNGNRLLGSVKGVDGLKTGYTNAAGHCLAFSCRRNGHRLIGMVVGFAKRQDCFDFAAALIDWGFRIP